MTLQKSEILDSIPAKIQNALEKVHLQIVGQDRVLSLLIISLLSQGHAIIVGIPGLAKTMMVKALSSVLGLTFSRIQFTPDLMPADILGYEIIQEDEEKRVRTLRFIPGPIFAHFLLADEINRTPPKTQAALLQAMQEKQVTIGNKTYPLEPPFHVVATQNPIEQEGTYPLPEALLDRFMMSIPISYPDFEEELIIGNLAGKEQETVFVPLLTREEILSAQQIIPYLPISEELAKKAVLFCRATRRGEKEAHPLAQKNILFGASPRALQHWLLSAKASAFLAGRAHVNMEDLKTVLLPVFRHRLLLNLEAQAGGQTVESILQELADTLL